MPKQIFSKQKSKKVITALVTISACLVITLFSFTTRQTPQAHAATSAELRAQASVLQSQISANTAKVKELAGQADSLKKTIAGLDIQIDQTVAQIQLIDVKIADLQVQLDKTQAELDRQKELLKASMRALYKKGGVSTVELLAASDSFSSFINDQEYLERLKLAVQDSTEKVITLKQQIQTQKTEQETLRKQQEAQKQELENSRGERSNLLAQTEGDEARFSDLVSQLRSQQAEVNRALFAQVQLERGDGSNGGYPYDNWPFSMAPGACVAGDGPDRWGYCTRQCVSYAAWAVERSGRQAPMYYGNANTWIIHANSDGVPHSGIPRNGDVGIKVGGTWGHAMYVDEVYGNGSIRISQYNAQLDGRYTEATLPQSSWSGVYEFIHFQ